MASTDVSTEYRAGNDDRSTVVVTTVTPTAVTATRARCSGSTACRCGQQLDVNTRAHCPRCGRAVHRG